MSLTIKAVQNNVYTIYMPYWHKKYKSNQNKYLISINLFIHLWTKRLINIQHWEDMYKLEGDDVGLQRVFVKKLITVVGLQNIFYKKTYNSCRPTKHIRQKNL